MKNRLLTLAGALALTAVIGKFYAVPVLAQVRAALVKNIDEKGRSPYQADSSCIPAPMNTSCGALFPAVPAGKRLVIEYVNADTPSGSAAALVNTSTNADYPLPTFLRFNPSYGISAPVLIYVEAGQQVKLNSTGTVTSAHITGYVVDLTQ